MRDERKYRIASKVFEDSGTDCFAKIKNEVVIRRTDGGKQEIKATFYEDDRSIKTLTFQRYGLKTGNPYQSAYFSFMPDEINSIVEFLTSLKLIQFGDDMKVNLTDTELRKLLIDKNKVTSILHADPEAVMKFVRNDITSEDVIALAYRKKQLESFQALFEPKYMANAIKHLKVRGEEDVWQKFFEKNPWIFGYGLNYIFNSNLDGKKLEQSVSGYDVTGGGKRVDGLLKTRGAINSLCFVEIKTATTCLLANKSYRKDCWSVSTELSGAIAQVHGSVEAAKQIIHTKLEPTYKGGEPTGETLFNFQPRSYVVVG